MGAWQYSVNLIPALGVVREHGCVPRSITVPRVTPETLANVDAICDTRTNYWLGLSDSFVASVEAQLESWLVETDSWSPNARMFGDDDTLDQLSIWRNDDRNLERINILFSLSNPDPNNLARMMAFPSLKDCLLLGIQSESVYIPTLENWLSDMRTCSAVRYLRGRDYPVPKGCG